MEKGKALALFSVGGSKKDLPFNKSELLQELIIKFVNN